MDFRSILPVHANRFAGERIGDRSDHGIDLGERDPVTDQPEAGLPSGDFGRHWVSRVGVLPPGGQFVVGDRLPAVGRRPADGNVRADERHDSAIDVEECERGHVSSIP